jgi:CRISPR-associated endonuclease/helicase Cas3
LLADLYDIQPIPTWQRLWAKTNRDNTKTHPLICHMIDVAQVTLIFWNEVLTESVRNQLANILGLNEKGAGQLIAFWAGLHDLGKASPCFQRKYKPAQNSLSKAGLPFPKLFSRQACPHGTISTQVLFSLLAKENNLSARTAKQIARTLGGHHGTWPPPREVQRLKATQMGDETWDQVRKDLFIVLHDFFSPPQIEYLNGSQVEINAFLTLLSGLVSTADWIGSIEKYFPYREAPIDPVEYAQQASEQAYQALNTLGWIGWQPPQQTVSFQDLFPFPPYQMQEAVIDLAEQLDHPSLVIIEAPTGTGKTEAALYLADHWAHVCQQRGLYVAMPTMATSNQMFGRVKEVLENRYQDSLVNLHLIHSQARWSEDMKEIQLKTFDEREGGTVAAMGWFLPRKRSLLATFGVGTVDQTFLSVLQTRHFFVRLLGLSHKTVIFDEVHAYDTYMSTLFQRLLGWLRSIGTSVVILSATLTNQSRQELLKSYAGVEQEDMPDISYPAITWAMEGQIGVVPLEASQSRKVALQSIERDPEDIVDYLENALQAGGCAAVICNTVGRAQRLYRAFRDEGLVADQNLILFHARFPSVWRDQIERKVLSRFGKNGDNRPEKAIVIATQVIEQSLDLDFDVMISDLAPIDLLIQRAGRLHRHQRDNRPASLSSPCLLVAGPSIDEESLDFGPDTYIYERYVLVRTYLALQDRDEMMLPEDTEMLIEAVYGEAQDSIVEPSPALGEALKKARSQMYKHRDEDADEAQKRLIPPPEAEDLLKKRNPLLEEDSPELHEALRALTRLGPPRISVVCLHQTEAGLTLEPDGSGPVINPNQEPSPELTEQLAQYALSISHWAVVQHLLGQPVPKGWQKHALLNDYRLVTFTDGICSLPAIPYNLRLSRQFGLEIEKEAR